MYRKIGPTLLLALVLSGCATSPFYVTKDAAYAPGFIPRNEMGEPVFPTKSKDKKKKARADRQTASAPTPAAPSTWLARS